MDNLENALENEDGQCSLENLEGQCSLEGFFKERPMRKKLSM
jgi:hypothetical protein